MCSVHFYKERQQGSAILRGGTALAKRKAPTAKQRELRQTGERTFPVPVAMNVHGITEAGFQSVSRASPRSRHEDSEGEHC